MNFPAAWRWQLHQLTIAGNWSDPAIGERWRATFGSLPEARAASEPNLILDLRLVDEVPAAPAQTPDFTQGELLAYYLNGPEVIAHFPRYGQLRLNLENGTTQGALTEAGLSAYGVFEDLLAIGLSPHLRRRGLFLLHAFAARPSDIAGAVLLAGDMGAGKTTTGLALLHAGWQLLSNDSPILARNGAGALEVLAYPGLLSAYPDTLVRFPELARLNTTPDQRTKTLFAAEAVYPGVWADSAPPGAVVFLHIEPRADHQLERLAGPEALRLILPHAIEQWDRAMIPSHLALLNQLVQSVPVYRLRLGPDTASLPDVLASALAA